MIKRIICGDNLEVLKTIKSESVDLSYIDPPFFSGKNYAVIWGDAEELRQFNDRWIKMNETGKYSKDINVYLAFMQPRIEQIYRVLKSTGSFYLHCDYHADSYLRILCDHIFGYNNLINEIIWDYGGASRTKTSFPKKHDVILLYSKSKNYVFKSQFQSIEQSYAISRSRTDPDGRKWVDQNLGNVSSETFEKMKSENRVFQTRSMKWRRKQYIDEMEGDQLTDVWDIDIINSQSKERLGYPTQKPEALLERIIKASSNKGDVVLDAFCGCGTTLAVSKRLKRQFIGIDVSPTSCRLMAKRINLPIHHIEGLPLTTNEIADMDGWEFQNWIITEFGANAIQGTKGADGGIDGKIFNVLIQVKKYKVGRKDLDEFSGMLLRNNKKEGIYLALEFTSTFKKEVARLKSENEIEIHCYSVNDIIDKKHHELIHKLQLDHFFNK